MVGTVGRMGGARYDLHTLRLPSEAGDPSLAQPHRIASPTGLPGPTGQSVTIPRTPGVVRAHSQRCAELVLNTCVKWCSVVASRNVSDLHKRINLNFSP